MKGTMMMDRSAMMGMPSTGNAASTGMPGMGMPGMGMDRHGRRDARRHEHDDGPLLHHDRRQV